MSGNNELNSSCDYVDFYNMVRKWTNYDYHTPKAKAEVIVDMLISDFITDIFDAVFPEEGENAVLLAKEFPIPGYVTDDKGYKLNSNKKSPAVDFLVKKGNKLYLVELKTSADSYGKVQFFRMAMAKKRGIKDLFEHYADVLEKTLEKSKYCHQVTNLGKGMMGQDKVQFSEDDLKERKAREYMKVFRDKYHEKDKNIEIIYLTLKSCKKTMTGNFKLADGSTEIILESNQPGKEINNAMWSREYTVKENGNTINEQYYIMYVDEIKELKNESKNTLWKKVIDILTDLNAACH